MKPIDQTAFKTETTRGNCMQAAVASILELPLESVPNFIEHNDPWGVLNKFLRGFNLRIFGIIDDYWPHTYYLATGLSPRNIQHMVVYHGRYLAHDPHPSRGGIVVEDKYMILPSDMKEQVRRFQQ